MAATIYVNPGFPVSNVKCESRFGIMGKGGHLTHSRSVGYIAVLSEGSIVEA